MSHSVVQNIIVGGPSQQVEKGNDAFRSFSVFFYYITLPRNQTKSSALQELLAWRSQNIYLKPEYVVESPKCQKICADGKLYEFEGQGDAFQWGQGCTL